MTHAISPKAPAPFAIGFDLVSVTEVAAAVVQHGRRYVERIFTVREADYCGEAPTPGVAAARFAARFAAKEAAFKALRWGDRPTDWRAIEVLRAPDGSCDLALHGRAREVAHDAGFVGFSVSLSHESEYAGAVVTAWRACASQIE